MRKKQLTMQQGLALGCLILLVCAVLFGIVLRATRSHDLEDPEKVAAAVYDLPTDNRADYDAAAEMLDISTAVEQLQDRIPLQVEITGMQPTYNNLRYTAKVLKTTDREQAGNTVVLYLFMSMEKMSDGKLHCDAGTALPLAVGHKYLLFYMVPIIYPLHRITSDWIVVLIKINPLYSMIELFRQCILYGQMMTWNLLLYASVVSLVTLAVGLFVFNKCSDKLIFHL